MSRYNPHFEAEPVFNTAEQWKEKCLLAGGSLFTDRNLWILENIKEVLKHFIDNLDAEGNGFFGKLENQLMHSSENAKLLASEMPITVKDIDSLTFDRTNNRYQSVLKQCRMFINGFPDVVSGRGNAFSLLFDMNQLFESWTAAMLKPIARQLEMKLGLQGPKKYIGYWEGNRNEVFQLQPDITFRKGKDNVEIIADAKWKILDDAESKMGISQSDLYQIQSYANRYEVNTLKLFYPKQNKLVDRKKLVIYGKYESELEIVPLDITKQKDTNFTLNDCFGNLYSVSGTS